MNIGGHFNALACNHEQFLDWLNNICRIAFHVSLSYVVCTLRFRDSEIEFDSALKPPSALKQYPHLSLCA